MNKYNKGQSFRRAIGKPCSYCEREMNLTDAGLLPTRDHVHPKSLGGQWVIWACDDCNFIKANMTLPEWERFMKANPQWWERRPRAAISRQERLQAGILAAQRCTNGFLPVGYTLTDPVSGEALAVLGRDGKFEVAGVRVIEAK